MIIMELWKQWTAAPHRVFFLPGAVQVVLVMFWWLIVLLARQTAFPAPEPAFPVAAAHVWLTLYGCLPFFVFGFLFTALPNWLSVSPIGRRDYLVSALLLAVGTLFFYPALYWPGLMPFALSVHGLGWIGCLWALWRPLRQPTGQDVRQPWIVWWSCVGGALGALSGAYAMLGGGALQVPATLGVWAFLTPLFLAVCHRMLPWFTSRVLPGYPLNRPHVLLQLWLFACVGHALLELLQVNTAVLDLPLAVSSLIWAWRWGARAAFKIRLLAMLHIAFGWAAVSFGLFFAADFGVNLGMAPLHALGIGFFGAMLIGMASRVSLGHSGHKLECDTWTWRVFWLIQVAAIARVFADVFSHPSALIGAAGLWLLAFVIWAFKYMPLTWRPRADGKPG